MFFGRKNGTSNKQVPETATSELRPGKPANLVADPQSRSTRASAEPSLQSQGSQSAARAPRDATPPSGPSAAQLKPSKEAKHGTVAATKLSVAFAQIVNVLIRSPQHRHLALADLEWLVYPPLTLGQFAAASVQAKKGGGRVPVAAVLWARVSADVDAKLSQNLTAPLRLRPDEWRSGDIYWLIEGVGEARAVSGLLRQLSESAFKGREVKMRARTEGGKARIVTLQQAMLAGAGKASTAAN